MINIGEGLTERLARQADELSTKAIESLERNHRPGRGIVQDVRA